MDSFEGIEQCLAIEYAAFYRKDALLSKLLANKNLSEIECPKIPLMCATLSSLIKNRESEHFDKAVDILWALYELAPDLIPFETFGNLLIDILICKILLAMVDTHDRATLVDNILKLFTIPPYVEKLREENRALLFDKYKAISQKLIDIVDDESRDLTLSFFELTGCDCVWVNLWSRVDSYIQKVNKKIGRPILGAFLHLEGLNCDKDKITSGHGKTGRSPSHSDMNLTSGADQTYPQAGSSHCVARTSALSCGHQSGHNTLREGLEGKEIEDQHQSVATLPLIEHRDLLNTSLGQENYCSPEDKLKDANDAGSREVGNQTSNEIGEFSKGEKQLPVIADVTTAKVHDDDLSKSDDSIILFDSDKEMNEEKFDLGTSGSEHEPTNGCSTAFLVKQTANCSECNDMSEDRLMQSSMKSNDVDKAITGDTTTKDKNGDGASSVENEENPRFEYPDWELRINDDKAITGDTTTKDINREDHQIVASPLENENNPRFAESDWKLRINDNEAITGDTTTEDISREDSDIVASSVENHENSRPAESTLEMKSEDVDEEITEDTIPKDINKKDSHIGSSSVQNHENPRSVDTGRKMKRKDVDEAVTEDMVTKYVSGNDSQMVGSCVENNKYPRSVGSSCNRNVNDIMRKQATGYLMYVMNQSRDETSYNSQNLMSFDTAQVTSSVVKTPKNLPKIKYGLDCKFVYRIMPCDRTNNCRLISPAINEKVTGSLPSASNESTLITTASHADRLFSCYKVVVGNNGVDIARINKMKTVNEAPKKRGKTSGNDCENLINKHRKNGGIVPGRIDPLSVTGSSKSIETRENPITKKPQKLNYHIDRITDLPLNGEKPKPIDKTAGKECELDARNDDEASVHIYINSDEDIVQIFSGTNAEENNARTCLKEADLTESLFSDANGYNNGPENFDDHLNFKPWPKESEQISFDDRCRKNQPGGGNNSNATMQANVLTCRETAEDVPSSFEETRNPHSVSSGQFGVADTPSKALSMSGPHTFGYTASSVNNASSNDLVDPAEDAFRGNKAQNRIVSQEPVGDKNPREESCNRVASQKPVAKIYTRTSSRIKEKKELAKSVLENITLDHCYCFDINKYICSRPLEEKESTFASSFEASKRRRTSIVCHNINSQNHPHSAVSTQSRTRLVEKYTLEPTSIHAQGKLICENKDVGKNNETVNRNSKTSFTQVITPNSSSITPNVVKTGSLCSTSENDRSFARSSGICNPVRQTTSKEVNSFEVSANGTREIGVNTEISAFQTAGNQGSQTESSDEWSPLESSSLAQSSDEESDETFFLPQRSHASNTEGYSYAESSPDELQAVKFEYAETLERKFENPYAENSIHRVYQRKGFKRKRRKRQRCFPLENKRRKLVHGAAPSANRDIVRKKKGKLESWTRLKKMCNREAVVEIVKL